MVNKKSRHDVRIKKHNRERNRFMGTSLCPRLTVFKSDKHIYAQIIDDEKKITLCSASTNDKGVDLKVTNTTEAATKIGETIGKKAVEKGIKTVVFDRSGYVYHGKVKALADAARAAGLEF